MTLYLPVGLGILNSQFPTSDSKSHFLIFPLLFILIASVPFYSCLTLFGLLIHFQFVPSPEELPLDTAFSNSPIAYHAARLPDPRPYRKKFPDVVVSML